MRFGTNNRMRGRVREPLWNPILNCNQNFSTLFDMQYTRAAS